MKVADYQPGELITILRKNQRSIAILFLIIFGSFIVDSCDYYKKKVRYKGEITKDEINKNLAKGKQFILVTSARKWQAENIKIIDDSHLNMNLVPIPRTGMLNDKLEYLKYNSSKRVKADNKILQQLVLMHLEQDDTLEAGNINLAFSDIGKIEIYDADLGKTIFVFLGITTGILVIIGVIYALTKSSCPFLYVYDGKEYQLAAETFGGAIYPGLERSDFVKLAMAQPEDGFYKFKIRNELKEHQYINKVRLIEARVPDNKSLNIDQQGIIHTIGKPLPPSSAVSDSGQDYTVELTSFDSTQFYFNDGQKVNSVTLSFDKPADVKTGKLLLTTKSTLWMDYVFGEFLKLFGLSYNTFADKQKQKTKDQMGQWSEDQYMPLTVSVYTNGDWIEVEQLQPIGPLAAARDIVIPIDLSDISDENIQVRLSTGFYFWEVDYAGMDYSVDEPIDTKYASPTIAEFNSHIISNGALNDDDSSYVVQRNVGDVLDLKFAPQFDDNTETMVFLEVSGYYTHIRDFKTLPEFEKLKTFRNPGRLSEFSRELFNNYSAPILAKNVVED